ncbi:MAG: phosphoglycerate kinase [Candidatus Liptonbacteria bacterium]|nr:phosphoglycerate kinase [Candidatus Liptonbacteria bacterium]
MIRYLSKASPKNLKGTAVLRLDFNTKDEWRMRAALPTIRLLLKHSSKIVILSHKGRPKGAEKKFSLKRDAAKLGRMLGKKIIFLAGPDFSKVEKAIAETRAGSVLVIENLRFVKGEKENDKKFAKKLASLGDFYVNDAFAVSHRKNASVAAITGFLPSFAGLELEREVKLLSRVIAKPKKPLVIVLGGAKAHDKLGVLKRFRKKASWFLLGGAAANTLLLLRGVDVKDSLVDKEKKDISNLRRVAGYRNVVLPVDVKFGNGKILDIGGMTSFVFSGKLSKAGTVIWSGPMGVFEKKEFSFGTLAVAKAIVGNKKVFSVAGGGETVMFLKKYKLDKKFSFISTGGGAMLDFLADEKLPGIEALKK